MDFQRASNGLLGFSINEAGVVKKVDGLAKSIGLQKDSCILQVEDRLLCAHTHTQITELLTDRRRVTVRAFVVPPSPAAARYMKDYRLTVMYTRTCTVLLHCCSLLAVKPPPPSLRANFLHRVILPPLHPPRASC